MGLALYGNGMHEYVLRELEVGKRVALFQDSETNAGWSALDDLSFVTYMREKGEL